MLWMWASCAPLWASEPVALDLPADGASTSRPWKARWVPVGPAAVHAVAVAIHRDNPDAWAVGDVDGGAWLTEDGGGSWRRIPSAGGAALSAHESLLIEVEARLRELTDDLADPSFGDLVDPDALDGGDELEPQGDAALREIGDWEELLRSELESDQGLQRVKGRNSHVRAVDAGFVWGAVEPEASTLLPATAAPIHAVARQGEVVLIVSGARVFRLQEGPPEPAPQPRASQGQPWIPLGRLLDAALRRSALPRHPGPRVASTLLPSVGVSFEAHWDAHAHWEVDSWTTVDAPQWWAASVQLTWRPHPTPGAGLAALQMNDRVVIDDGTASHLLWARVHGRVVRDRQALVLEIQALYRERVELAGSVAGRFGGPLGQQVQRALRLAEVDAHLDVLTDFAVSRWVGAASDPLP